MKRRTGLLTAALAGTAVLATACGSSNSAQSSGPSQPTGYRQFLAYSRCMRAHGAPFWPDPVILSSGVYDAPVGYQITARILDQEQGPGWQGAVTACQRLGPAGLAPEALPLTEQQIASLRSGLAKLAACMRSHGVAGFPSPVVGPSGGGFPSPGPSVDQDSAPFRSARQACQQYQPGS
jgi:hypothetical protein